jgi:hypothetical protein
MTRRDVSGFALGVEPLGCLEADAASHRLSIGTDESRIPGGDTSRFVPKSIDVAAGGWCNVMIERRALLSRAKAVICCAFAR